MVRCCRGTGGVGDANETSVNEQPRGDSDVLAEVVRRIVRVAAPERIVLFGSAAVARQGQIGTWTSWSSSLAAITADG